MKPNFQILEGSRDRVDLFLDKEEVRVRMVCGSKTEADTVQTILSAFVREADVVMRRPSMPYVSVQFWNTDTGSSGQERMPVDQLAEWIGANPYIIHQINDISSCPPGELPPVSWKVEFASSSPLENFVHIIGAACEFAKRNGLRESQIASMLSSKAMGYQDRP